MTRLLALLRPAILPGVVAGCAEHFLISCIEMAYSHGAMLESTYLGLLRKVHLLGLPGIYLPQLFGVQPYYWAPHSRGSVFWGDVTAYFLANIFGWIVILAAACYFWQVGFRRWAARTVRVENHE